MDLINGHNHISRYAYVSTNIISDLFNTSSDIWPSYLYVHTIIDLCIYSIVWSKHWWICKSDDDGCDDDYCGDGFMCMGHLPFFFIIAAFINPLAILMYYAILICISLKHKKLCIQHQSRNIRIKDLSKIIM